MAGTGFGLGQNQSGEESRLRRMVRWGGIALRYPGLLASALRGAPEAELREEYLRRRVGSAPWPEFRARALGKTNQSFRWSGRSYSYFYHPLNQTWMGERTVEIPIGWEFVRAATSKYVLEVGNVLARYFPEESEHSVVDKYERGPRILSVDVTDYDPPVPLERVVSLSTIEHVGWDELPRDPAKSAAAIRRMASWLRPDGRLLVTIPVGYRPALDQDVAENRVGFTRTTYLRRINRENEWRECSAEEALGLPYVDWRTVRKVPEQPPFPCANAIAVGEVIRDANA